MAIRIPILTSFDPKGLRQANAQFAKLQTSIGSLGRNFAVAGAAIAAAGAVIAKNAQSLARIERINAQTAQTIKSMGDTAGISALEVEKLAGSLEALTATEAESIQEGANLLLTFKNIQNQAGAGNDIFNQTTAVMVDLARAMGTSAAGEAIRLGKALNDPVKGIAALTRVGVSFTKQQEDQIKALANSGDLLGAQKIILAELQQQFGGSGAAFAQTFTGQLELMGHELGTIGEEATMSVMPALQGMVEQLRELIPVIGPQLKAAIESVDFVALGQAVVGVTTFLIDNAEKIVKLVAAIFILNTAFKLMAVASGIAKTAIALHTYFVAQAAAGMTIATVATNIFSTALKLIPFVAVAAGIGLVIAGIMEADSSYRTATPNVTSFGGELLKTGHDAKWAASQYGVLKTSIDRIPTKVKINVELETTVRNNELKRYLDFLGVGAGTPSTQVAPVINAPVVTGGGGGRAAASARATRAGFLPTPEADAIRKAVIGLGETTKKQRNATIKAVKEQFAAQAQSFAITQKAQQDLSQVNEAARLEAEELARSQEEAARKEADALAERERVYNSFLDSVKSTFSSIKSSIMGAFDLTQLGGSTNAITRNMDKLLTRMKAFATNVSKLSSMGLNPALLQQVISAGPMAGARLAESLVMGGGGALAAINAGFGEFGSLSSQIAQTGTESRFNTPVQQSIYNIEVSGGVGSGATIGKAIVDAIKSYERTSGAVFQGA